MAFPYVGDAYQVDVAGGVLLLVILGLGLNVVVGMAGLLDLGYAAFFAIGAYTSAILTADAGFSWWQSVIPAMVVAAAAGAVLGYPTLRLRGDYLAIVTLGFGEIVRIAAINLKGLTGGPAGKPTGSRPEIFGQDLTGVSGFYWLALSMALLTMLATRNVNRSRLGRAWESVREDEVVAEAVGVHTWRVKLFAYVFGALWAGLAGALAAGKFGLVSPTSFTFTASVLVLVAVVLGGRGSIPGVVLGAILVGALPEVLRSFEEWKFVAFGLALILLMLVRPQGLWPRGRGTEDPPDGLAMTAAELLAAAQAGPTDGQPAGPVLTVTRLGRRFGGLVAVDEVSFCVFEGEILGLIGPNGAGKTTVFNTITGLVTPTSGRVEACGTDVTGLAPHRVVAAGVARTFQGARLFSAMSAADNVLAGMDVRLRVGLTGALLRLPRQRREERDARGAAQAWLEFVGLGGTGGRPAGELALLDQRRVEIARALASRPRALLLDEPAAGLNPVEKRSLAALIRRVRQVGITVVVIEHDMEFVGRVCDRVLVMDAGRLLAEGTPNQIQTDPQVIEAYLGTDDKPRFDTDPGLGPREEDAGVPLLEVAGLRAGYGATNVLSDLSFEVRSGEVVALLGANGAGKSTALRTISGLLASRAGSVRFEGADITHARPHRIVGRGLVHVPQGQRVFDGLSVAENLRLGAFLSRRQRHLVDLRREAVYELFPRLEERRAQAAGTLSGGERQMLAIGRALMGDPRLLCLDEPSMGLSPLLVRRIFAAVAAIAEQGNAVLLVEQNVAGALRLADRVYVLESGGIVLQGPAAELTADPRIRAAYLGGPPETVPSDLTL
ncbi:MAG TPA: ATP-binding cassette domain-containing protein [Sporichthya sp.]|nr:ATP-binding cassette domain-containing protein [Sporichthya sp.]